jgi:DNA polymerase-3 subunit alpha
MNEKPALGFFLSGHPYNAYAAELGAFVKRRLGQLEPQRDTVLLAGVVMSTRTQMTRRGKMAVVALDDGTTQLEVTVFNELWEAERAKIKEDELLLVEGKVQKDDYSGGLRITADKLYTLAEARGRFARGLRLTMNGGSDAKRLQALLMPFRNGPCPVRLSYRNGDAVAELPLPETWRVRLDDALLTGLADWLKPENVKVIYP